MPRFFTALYSDGFKALGLVAPVASIATTICKWVGVPVGDIDPKDISWGWAFAPLALWLLVAYIRRWISYNQHIEGSRGNALEFSQMPVTEIAEYLRDESAWGWETYSRLNLKSFVSDLTPSEMRRAGKAGEVRYVGTPANGANAMEIDRTYWHHAEFDEGRIWDDRNAFFTAVLPSTTVPGYVNYQFGSAPRIEVLRTWSRASFIKKCKARIWVLIKRSVFWLEKVWRNVAG